MVDATYTVGIIEPLDLRGSSSHYDGEPESALRSCNGLIGVRDPSRQCVVLDYYK